MGWVMGTEEEDIQSYSMATGERKEKVLMGWEAHDECSTQIESDRQTLNRFGTIVGLHRLYRCSPNVKTWFHQFNRLSLFGITFSSSNSVTK